MTEPAIPWAGSVFCRINRDRVLILPGMVIMGDATS